MSPWCCPILDGSVNMTRSANGWEGGRGLHPFGEGTELGGKGERISEYTTQHSHTTLHVSNLRGCPSTTMGMQSPNVLQFRIILL